MLWKYLFTYSLSESKALYYEEPATKDFIYKSDAFNSPPITSWSIEGLSVIDAIIFQLVAVLKLYSI